MSSLVRDFQRDVVQSGKPTTELLRIAKLISAKLGLSDISTWIDYELAGYPPDVEIPKYRIIQGGTLEALNPVRGWQTVGHVGIRIPVGQSIGEIDELVKQKNLVFPLSADERIPLSGIASSFSQHLRVDRINLVKITNGVRDKLLDWSTELESRGILGENMTFDMKERESAKSQTFNIQNFTGVLGDVSHSRVEVYNYSTVHEMLRQQNVPQPERNALENLMDELKHAEPQQKPGLIERGKAWITKNADFLGASASIVRKALGIGSEP
jgi:hypothetical protein